MWRNHLIKGYMADYYNYIDAPFEREGIADTLHTIMHALKKLLRDRLPEDLDTQYGLRHYIASHFDGDISGWRPNLMFYLAAGWSYHSGSMYYPIPSHIPEKTAEDIYYDDVPKWDGKALWYRRALASYIFTRAHGLLQIIEPDLWESEFGVQWWERQLPILESIYRVLRKVDWLNGDIPRGYAYSSIYDYIIYNMDNEKLYFQGIDIYWWVIALQWGVINTVGTHFIRCQTLAGN